MAAYDEATAAGEGERIYGRIGRMIGGASKTAGMAETQFEDWGKSKTSTQDRKGEEGAYRKETETWG